MKRPFTIESLESRHLNFAPYIPLPTEADVSTARDFDYHFATADGSGIVTFTADTPTGPKRYAGTLDRLATARAYELPSTDLPPAGYGIDSYSSNIAKIPLMLENDAEITGGGPVYHTIDLAFQCQRDEFVDDLAGHPEKGTINGYYYEPATDLNTLVQVRAKPGDVNKDGLFDSTDLVELMIEGRYSSDDVEPGQRQFADFWKGRLQR